ncbi:MAG TPA: alpha-(1-_3)-arabinofuranosyltransferase family protein [Iamia sp.]
MRVVEVVRRPIALVGLFATLAAIAVTTSAPGRYVGENRVDQYFAPGHRLVRTLWLWDPTRGLGRPREDLWPLQIGPLAAFRGLGLSEVASQRLFHGLLLVVAASGAAAVLRHVRDDGEAEAGTGVLAPLLAGVLYGFGPYAITFLTPANLFAAYAVAPWVVLCALRGSGSAHPWRWAAGAALIVGALGNADYPGVVLSLVGVPVAALWASARRGRGVGTGLAWLARAGGLTVAVSAAALWKTATASAVFAQRVTTTESPETVGVASSWSETWRGLGFWLSYFRTDVLARPQTADYFTDPAITLVTFVPAVAALAALGLREVRGRVLLGATAVLSAVVMVGVHPVDDQVPLGRGLLRVLDATAATAGFRTTYKAGAGLVLGIAVLAALATDALARRAGRRGQGRALVGAVAVVVVAVAGLPAWTGDLYDSSRTSGPVPGYWHDAARSINALPGEGRLLVLPASTRTVYEWGWVGDDILDSLITRPHAVDTAVPLSGPEAADVLAAVSQAASDARHRPGAVAAVLRRLGIDHVLIRNDVDAEATRTIAPGAIDRLRSDPALELVGVFGDLGRTATATAEGGDSGRLGQLELYAVADPGAVGPRLAPTDGQLVVSGSGDAMVALGADGDLASAGPVRFSGALDGAEAAAALDDGRLVLSDTNRRRVTVVNALVRGESWTLAAGEDLDREADAPYDAPGSQTVAWYRDATRITSSGAPRGGRGAQSWTRPAAAFDANAATWWQTVETADQEGITLRAELREPQEITRLRVEPLDAPRSTRRLTEVVVRTSDGTETTLDVGEGGTEVDVETGPSDWVEIEITGVSDGADRPVGIREVEVDGADGPLDLREWIALPDDLVRRAERDGRLAAALEAAPVSVLMMRDQPEAPFPVEPVLRRRVRLPRSGEATVSATARPADQAAADLLLTLAGGECGDESLTIDGEPVALTLAEDEVEIGVPARLRSCDPVALDAGWHEVEARAGTALDTVRLDVGGPGPVAAEEPEDRDPPGTVTVREETPDRLRLTVDAPDGGVVLSGQSYDERWLATVDGKDLGPAGLYDGQSGWVVPAGRDLDVVLELRPARRYRVASWISLAGVATCVTLLVRPGLRRRRGPRPGDRRDEETSAGP